MMCLEIFIHLMCTPHVHYDCFMGVEEAKNILFITCYNCLEISGHIHVILPAAKVGRLDFHGSRVIL